jgi:hypothetical protein
MREKPVITVPNVHPLLDYPSLPSAFQTDTDRAQEDMTGHATSGLKARADAMYKRLVFSRFKTRAAVAVKNNLSFLRDQDHPSQEAIAQFGSCIQV